MLCAWDGVVLRLPKNRMKELFTSGSVGGPAGNRRSYPTCHSLPRESTNMSTSVPSEANRTSTPTNERYFIMIEKVQEGSSWNTL